jgi:hypothetical protein
MKRRKATDITGRRYGKLTAVRMKTEGDKVYGSLWEMRCDCGNTAERHFFQLTQSVKRGYSPSCADCRRVPRRDRTRAVSRVTLRNYREFIPLMSEAERGEYERLMRRHGRCPECAEGFCGRDAVCVVLAERESPTPEADAGHLHARRDYAWQYRG